MRFSGGDVRLSHPVRKRSPCLVGANLFCRGRGLKLGTTMLCGHVKGHVVKMNHDMKDTKDRGAGGLPGSCRVPHGAVSLSLDGGFNH